MSEEASQQQVLRNARELAYKAHEGQVDKVGKDYVEAHVSDVAARVRHLGPKVEAVAWLHDVVEDTDVTEAELRELFPDDVVDAVVAITKNGKGETRDDYYGRVKANELARQVKLVGDIPSNTDPARVALLEPEKAAKFAVKYAHAREMLA